MSRPAASKSPAGSREDGSGAPRQRDGARGLVAAIFRPPSDDDRLLSYCKWLQQYTDETTVPGTASLSSLAELDQSLQRLRSSSVDLVIAAIRIMTPPALRPLLRPLGRGVLATLYPFYRLQRIVRRAASIVRTALQPVAVKARGIRRRLGAAVRVQLLQPLARRTAYDLLIRNGDARGAARAFGLLSQLDYQPHESDVQLDRFVLGMLPALEDIERKVAEIDMAAKRAGGMLISLPLLGRSDIDLFECYAAPSLLARGNLPRLSGDCEVFLHVLAAAGARARLAQSPCFAALETLCSVRFTDVPDDLIDAATGRYRAWLRAALNQQSCRLAARLQADLHIADPGTIYADDHLRLLRWILEGRRADIIVSTSLRADCEKMRSSVEAQRRADGSIELTARALHTLGLRNLHASDRNSMVTSEQLRHGRMPNVLKLMWQEGDSLVVHAARLRPLLAKHYMLDTRSALCYFDVSDPVVQNWMTMQDVPPYILTAREQDGIGYVEIGESGAGDVATCPPAQWARSFWTAHAAIDLRLLKQEVRLSIDGSATAPPASEAAATRPAFDALIDMARRSRPPGLDVTGLDVTPGTASGPMPLDKLVNMADAVFRLEISAGCGALVDARIEELRDTIRDGRAAYQGTAVERDSLVQLAVCLLRLGLFEELVLLRERFSLPFDDALSSYIDYCSEAYAASKNAGEEWRREHADEDLFVVNYVVWGEEFIRNFMEFNIRSILAPNNLPGIASQGICRVMVTTDADGRAAIERHPLYQEVAKHAEWHFAIIPDELRNIMVARHLGHLFYLFFGLLEHVGVIFAQGANSHLFMIPVDSIVADGSFVSMANYRHAGYECCGGGNLVAENETFLPALAERYRGQTVIAISTFDLASLAVAHPHHYFVSQVICRENRDFGRHPRELFWPVPEGMEIHSCFVHPLFTTATALQRYVRKHYANIDYGMIPRMFDDTQRFKVIEDPTEAYINNFTSRTRRHPTTELPFDYAIFLEEHRFTYPVQKSLFIHPQKLPCRYQGITPSRNREQDVAELWKRLRPDLAMQHRQNVGTSQPARTPPPAET